MKKKLDLNQLAKSIVDQATGEEEINNPPPKRPRGQSGGFAKAYSLSKEERLKESKKLNDIKREKQSSTSVRAVKPRIKV